MLLVSAMAWAAETLNWTFSIDNPMQFDPTQIELVNGVVRLKLLNQTDNGKNNFGGGTQNNTAWEAQNQWLSVAQPLTLPDNASVSAWTNMTNNTLLLHLDAAAQISGTTKTYSDTSGQNLSPSCTGAACPQIDANGKLGNALWFDGLTNYVVVPGTWGGAAWTQVTLEAWIKVSGKSTNLDKMQAIVSATNAGMFLHFQMLDTANKFNVAVYANTGIKVVGFDTSAPVLTIDSWHHVAVTVKTNEIILYADGQKVGGAADFAFASISPIGGNDQLRIGAGYGNARFFKGVMDEVAIYNRALSAAEIKAHYDQQSSAVPGYFDSRILNVGSPVEWTSLAWLPVGPNGIQLPDNGGLESGYVTGNVNMAGNVLLAHLNETAGTNFADASGIGNKGSCVGNGCPTLGQDGKFATALSFDGVDDQISIPNTPSLNVTKAVTVEAWINPKAPGDANHGSGVISKGNGGNDGRYELMTWQVGGRNVAYFRLAGHVLTGTLGTGLYGGTMSLNTWSHLVGTYDGSNSSLYVNGILVASAMTSGDITTDANPLLIGVRQMQSAGTGQSHFKGLIDEAAVYNRALSATEVANRYLRGAMQPKFQVRSCDKLDCAGKNFVGPGNSDKTYYTPLATATVPTQTAALTGIPASPYFQYRVYFDSASASLFPALKSVSVGPNHYPATNPVVTVPTDVDYVLLDSFSDILGDKNQGEVRYQLSPDGQTWYFCYGVKWKTVTDPAVVEIQGLGELQKTNSAAKVGQCAPSFATAAGTGKIFFKAFLHSPTAVEPVELKQVNVGYAKVLPAVPPPPPPPEPKTLTLSDVPTLTVAEGSKLNLTLDVSKAGMTAPYEYMCQANCPEGMSISSATGEIAWVPDYKQAGKYPGISFKVKDAAGKDATQILSVVVQDVEAVPQISNPGDKVVNVGQNVSFTVSAKDPDGGVPTYTLASGLQDGMAINASTGYFNWTPSPTQSGNYTVVLRAVDSVNPKLVSDQAVVIVVNKSETSSITGGNAPEPASLPVQPPPIPPAQTTTQVQPQYIHTPAPAASGCSLIR